MRKGKYEALREQYPEQISLDQLYRICKISKRSALYLIVNKIIPAEDTGRKTWKYRIALDDVITYLRRREQCGSMIPVGTVSSRNKYSQCTRKSYAGLVSQGAEAELGEYFEYIYAEYPDILTANEVAEMTGLAKETILRYLKAGDIHSLGITNKYIIPKEYVMEFVVSRKFIECKSNSEVFLKVLRGFEIWRATRQSVSGHNQRSDELDMKEAKYNE